MRVVIRVAIFAWALTMAFAMCEADSGGAIDLSKYLICIPDGQGMQTLFLDLELP